jgi:glycosyltransferase involved in cell wall biosynthesis
MKYKTVSIIIPAFNEEKYLPHMLDRVIKANTLGLKKEIIIVDDASRDDTIAKLKAYTSHLKANSQRYLIRVILKKVNAGKGAALRTGFLASTGDIVIIQDADLEYDPGEYPILLEPFIDHDADVVYGSRFVSYRPHRVLYFWHYLANICLTTLSNMLTNLNLTDMETGFKVFHGDIIRGLAPRLQSNRFGFEPEVTAKLAKIKGIKIFEVGISYWGRTYEEGKKIGWRDGIRAVGEIIKYNLFS